MCFSGHQTIITECICKASTAAGVWLTRGHAPHQSKPEVFLANPDSWTINCDHTWVLRHKILISEVFSPLELCMKTFPQSGGTQQYLLMLYIQSPRGICWSCFCCRLVILSKNLPKNTEYKERRRWGMEERYSSRCLPCADSQRSRSGLLRETTAGIDGCCQVPVSTFGWLNPQSSVIWLESC